MSPPTTVAVAPIFEARSATISGSVSIEPVAVDEYGVPLTVTVQMSFDSTWASPRGARWIRCVHDVGTVPATTAVGAPVASVQRATERLSVNVVFVVSSSLAIVITPDEAKARQPAIASTTDAKWLATEVASSPEAIG